jgi:zinc-ribbon family
MIFIAGVSPKIKVLDQNPRRCPLCGSNQAYFKRTDYYLCLFFIPLLRVKKGQPFMMCDRCEKSVKEFGLDFGGRPQEGAGTCGFCGSTLDKNFKYCPQCGKRL